MKILTWDTSGAEQSVAVLAQGQVLAQSRDVSGASHTETLLENIDRTLRQSGLSPQQLDFIGVTLGPGSFTGLRIGLATAKAFAKGLGIPLLGESTLRVFAETALGSVDRVATFMDARHGQVYGALYNVEVQGLNEVLSPRILSWDQFGEILKGASGRLAVVGLGASFSEFLRKNLSKDQAKVLPLPEEGLSPYLGRIFTERLRTGFSEFPQDLAPHYLRLSEAERHRQS